MISIVTPTFNSLQLLMRTIELIKSSSSNHEHIIVDGGSTDGTVEYLKSLKQPNIRFVSEPDQGMYDAIQKGMGMAQGTYLGWLNAGDYYYPWTLTTVCGVFDKLKTVEWLTGVPARMYPSGNVEISSYTPIYWRWIVKRGLCNGKVLPLIQQESTFWRKSLWERSCAKEVLQGQGRGRGIASDFKLWCRFANFADLYTIRTPLAAFAITPGQLSEKHRLQYFQDCGLKKIPAQPNLFFHQSFKLFSIALGRRAISISTLGL